MGFIELVQLVDINAFSLIILMILLITIRNKFKQDLIPHRLFNGLILMNMLLSVIEILGWVFDANAGMTGPTAHWLNQTANACLYALVPMPAVLWFLYAHYQVFHDPVRLRRVAAILALPALANLVLSIASLRTGWFFYVDIDNYYTRGRFFFVHVVIVYSIILAACLMILVNRRLLEKRSFWALLLFVVPQIVGGGLQVLVYGLSLNWASMMVSIMIVYLNLQDRGLNTDFLTGTYNRRHFEQIINNRIRRIGTDPSFAVVLCDMDRFKGINDQFGHQAGDEALQHTVHLLRGTIRKNDLIARFGGDEFYLLLELNDENAFQAAISRIYRAFERFNQTSSLPYLLELSIGGSIYDPQSALTADQFLRRVDQLMYQEKSRRRTRLADYGQDRKAVRDAAAQS